MTFHRLQNLVIVSSLNLLSFLLRLCESSINLSTCVSLPFGKVTDLDFVNGYFKSSHRRCSQKNCP